MRGARDRGKHADLVEILVCWHGAPAIFIAPSRLQARVDVSLVGLEYAGSQWIITSEPTAGRRGRITGSQEGAGSFLRRGRGVLTEVRILLILATLSVAMWI